MSSPIKLVLRYHAGVLGEYYLDVEPVEDSGRWQLGMWSKALICLAPIVARPGRGLLGS